MDASLNDAALTFRGNSSCFCGNHKAVGLNNGSDIAQNVAERFREPP